MKISYAITVCNEFQEIQRLINFLFKHKQKQDEIVVLFDSINGIPTIEEFLRAKSIGRKLNWFNYSFDGNFAKMKNRLTDMCTGDYIFNIDADEIPNEYLVENLWAMLEMNPTIDVYGVPRINTVEGLTQDHINKWGWNVNKSGWVNFPDYQYRIYRNDGRIKWKNKVHEVLTEFEVMSVLPPEGEYCLLHEKTIDRQVKQNELYSKL
tara:strand:+ start:13840 stop:14463 length:624 start_codon:yes stop_codon:yes gene_type:complete